LKTKDRRIFGIKRKEVIIGCRKLHNDELHNFTFRLISIGQSNHGGLDRRGIQHTMEKLEINTYF
jgi:hypothetical protein